MIECIIAVVLLFQTRHSFFDKQVDLIYITSMRSSNQTSSQIQRSSLFTNTTSTVKSIPFTTQKELISKLEEINQTLGSTSVRDEKWTNRLNAIKTLHGLALGDCIKQPHFMQSLARLHVPLSKQFFDARSVVIKEVCATIADISINGTTLFEPYQELFIKDLLKMLSSTNTVMRDSGNKAITSFLRSCDCNKTLPHILDVAMNKVTSAYLRQRCADYLRMVLIAQCIHGTEPLSEKTTSSSPFALSWNRTAIDSPIFL